MPCTFLLVILSFYQIYRFSSCLLPFVKQRGSVEAAGSAASALLAESRPADPSPKVLGKREDNKSVKKQILSKIVVFVRFWNQIK